MPGEPKRIVLCSAMLLGLCAATLGSCSDLVETPSGDVIRARETGGAGPLATPDNERDAGAGIDECVVQKQEANLRPVYLLFLLDQSGSMGDGEHGSREQKWDPVSEALQTFFADPGVQRVSASLTLFPPNINMTSGPAQESFSTGDECDVDNYDSPEVPLSLLPETELFASAIASVTPPNEMRTPTRAVLEGALKQAEALESLDPNAAIAIVLVTDGEPYCTADPEPIGLTLTVTEKIAERFPVYVVGVGAALASLNQIASAGGTQEAFELPVDEPARTSRFLLDAIKTIHGEVIPCEAPIPTPPAGKIFDKEKVAVEYVVDDVVTNIEYDGTCSTRQGWRYDDPDDPQVVQLCDTTCSTLQRLQTSTLRVVFACQRLIDLVR